MLDADAVINNSSQKVGGSGPRKHTGSTPVIILQRLTTYFAHGSHQFVAVPPDGDGFGVAVDALRAVVVELAVA